jgi:hypothetical protein
MKQVLTLALLLGLLAGCALEHDVPLAAAGPLDSTLRAAGLSPRKVKFTGPVTLQIGGTGNTAAATAIAKAKAPVASAPHATATEATTKAAVPWWLYAGGAALALLAGWLLRGRWP